MDGVLHIRTDNACDYPASDHPIGAARLQPGNHLARSELLQTTKTKGGALLLVKQELKSRCKSLRRAHPYSRIKFSVSKATVVTGRSR